MKITLITPCFNAEKTIEKTILSILRQKTADVQYIIIDGASTDKTKEIISKYEKSIDVIISEKDNGIADAYNKGITHAEGDLIGIVAADDQLILNALSTVTLLYDGTSDVICGNVIDYNGQRYIRRYSGKNLPDLFYRTSLMHPATFISKNAYSKYNGYSSEYKCAIDRELFLRFYKSGATFQVIDADIVFFNQGGISTQNPCTYAYPEDAKISIDYGMPVLKAKYIFLKSVLQYYSQIIAKKILKTFALHSSFNKLMEKNGHYVNNDQIKKFDLY